MPKPGGRIVKPKICGETSSTVNTVVSSFEEDDEVKVVNILNAMDISCFTKLRRYFSNPGIFLADGVPRRGIDRENIAISEVLSRTEFVLAMEKIIGQSGIAASQLFDEVDKKQSGYISWQEFLDHSLQAMGEPETVGKKLIISRKAEFYGMKHFMKTDGIAKIIPLKIGPDLRYEVVSMRGLVSRYDAEFKPLPKSEYSIPLWGFQEPSTHGSAQSFAAPRALQSAKAARPWITDVTFMDDVNVIIFAASDRSLHFRDVGGRGFPWMFHISGLRNLPTCMAYMSPMQSGSSEGQSELEKGNTNSATHQSDKTALRDSVLLIGDDMGNIWTLKFLQPQESLFHRSRRKGEGAEQIHWLDLERGTILGGCLGIAKGLGKEGQGAALRENPHRKYVELSVRWGVHAAAVSQVSFCGNNPFAVVSCSSGDRFPLGKGKGSNGAASLILKTESSRAAPYIFRIPSGISCFDLWENEEDLDCFLLATGSSDALIRLWNPFDSKKATTNLTGHKDPIKDIKFSRRADLMLLITICSNAEIRIWKTSDGGCHEHSCCLQVLPINFSAIVSLNKTAQFGSKVLYIQENQITTLLVACGNEIAAVAFVSSDESHSQVWETEPVNGLGCTSEEYLSQGGEVLLSKHDENEQADGGNQLEENVEVFQTISAQKLTIFSRATEFTKPAKTCLGINQRQSLQQKYQKEMRKFVSLCTPHLALPIYSPAFIASQPSVKHPNPRNKANGAGSM